jgi:hypothetical protein
VKSRTTRRLIQLWLLALMGSVVVAELAYLSFANAYESQFTVEFTYPGCPVGTTCLRSAAAVTFVALQLTTNPFLGETVRRTGGLLPPEQILQQTRVNCGVQPASRGELLQEEWTQLQFAMSRSDDWQSLVRQLRNSLPAHLLSNVAPCWRGSYHAFRLQVVVQDANPDTAERLSTAWSDTIMAAIVTDPDISRVVTHARLSSRTFHDLRLERSLGLGAGFGGLGLLVSLLYWTMTRPRNT